MPIKTVLFDLDATLLPMDQDAFTKVYFSALASHCAPLGYDGKELIDTVLAGVKAMVRNDGTKTNETVFWEVFCENFGDAALAHKPAFDSFYINEFPKLAHLCGFNPAAAETVHSLHSRGIQTVLATNPIFPATAIEHRIRWAGLEPEDFVLRTTYENFGFCKPNPSYYKDILNRIGCNPEDCLMVGNDVAEDMVAASLGLKVFLLTDCIINRAGTDISDYPRGSYKDLNIYINSL